LPGGRRRRRGRRERLPLAGASYYDVPAGVGDLARVRAFFTEGGRLLPGASVLSRYPDSPPASPPAEAAVLGEALVYACHGSKPGRLELARFLIERGARPAGLAFRMIALHAAAWAGDVELARLLLRHGADPGARDPVHRGTPADWAAYNHHPECAAALRAGRE
jgi:hypothetical protein